MSTDFDTHEALLFFWSLTWVVEYIYVCLISCTGTQSDWHGEII